MDNKQQNKNNKHSGFTLAEVLVVIGMISILLSIGGLSVLQYQKVLKLSELDTIAREIFVVAQNQIIKAKASGEWEELIQTHKDNREAYLGQSMTEKPSDYPEGEVWPEEGKGNEHDYRYIVYNNELQTLENTILNKILPYGAIDEHIRKDGQYVIEYDYKTGNIYGVFYTESSQKIDYNTDIMGLSGLDHNKGRENSKEGRAIRKNYKNSNGPMIIGYYGGAVINEIRSNELQPLDIQVNNGDTLEIIIRDSNYNNIIDGRQVQTQIALTITGEESQTSVTKILGEESINRNSTGESWWERGIENNMVTYTLTLDSINGEGKHFADIFPELIPGENITVTAEAFSEQVLCTPTKVQAYTNSLFELKENNEESATAIISNIRHLQNLNPNISEIPTEKEEKEETTKGVKIITKAKQRTSIVGGETYFYGIDNIALEEYEGNGYTLSNFKLQPNDKGNVGLFAQVGNEETSQNLTVKNLKLEGFVSETQTQGASAGTLIGEVKQGTLTAENISVINPTVKVASTGYAGGLVGKMSEGELSQCGVYLTDDNSTSSDSKTASKKYELGAYNADNNIQGNQYIVVSSNGVSGGLVGKVENTVIKDSFTALPISDSGNGIAGGLVGKISGNVGQKTTITNSYTGGYTIEGKYSSYYGVTVLGSSGIAGGLIGQDGAQLTTVENSYSTASIYGNMVGGFVGDVYGDKSTYKNCYATGKVTGINTNSSRDGFIGKLKDASTIFIEQCYYLKQSNGDLTTSVSAAEAWDYDTFIDKIQANGETGELQYAPYDQTLKNIDYPFRTVTKMVIGEGINHYGDWPLKDEQQVTGSGDIGVLYYEIIDNELYYHGYFAEYSSNELKPNYKEVMTEGTGLVNGLITTPNKYVSEDGYIVLVPEGTDLNTIAVAVGDGKTNTGEKWTLSQCVEPFNNENLFYMEGFDVYYFAKELNIYTLSYITIGENTNPWYPVFGDYASFCFNPFFADTVKTEKVVEEKIHIRSARHLLNMKKLEWSHSNKSNIEYIQSLDISYQDIGFTQNGKEQSYKYETIGMISADYTVKEYSDGTRGYGYVIKGLEVPLFGTITGESTIKGVTLLNSRVKASVDVGSFATTNQGIIENCSVRVETTKENSYNSVEVESSSNAAGFVYYNLEGTIKNSYFEGIVKGQIASGFVVINQGMLENCRAHAEISASNGDVTVDGLNNAAGFVETNRGTIRNSYFEGIVKGQIASGFVITNEGTIEGCKAQAENTDSNGYNLVVIEGSNNAVGFTVTNRGTITSSWFVGTVRGEKVSGFVDINQGTIENSYADAILIGNNLVSGFVETNQGIIESCSAHIENPDSNGYNLVTIEHPNYAAGFAYYNFGGTIRNSSFSGTVKGQTVSGFAITNGYNGIITNCSVHAQVADSNGYNDVVVEGLNHAVGFVVTNQGTVNNSYFVGTVKGGKAIGFADTNNWNIVSCYANVILKGDTLAVGFLNNNNQTLENCFSVGSVESNTRAFGFMGRDETSGVVKNCYAALSKLKGKEICYFGTGKGFSYKDCNYLASTHAEGTVLKGNVDGLKVQGTAMSYDEMAQKRTNPITYPYSDQLQGKQYPFELISIGDKPVEFWGDWPIQN